MAFVQFADPARSCDKPGVESFSGEGFVQRFLGRGYLLLAKMPILGSMASFGVDF